MMIKIPHNEGHTLVAPKKTLAPILKCTRWSEIPNIIILEMHRIILEDLKDPTWTALQNAQSTSTQGYLLMIWNHLGLPLADGGAYRAKNER